MTDGAVRNAEDERVCPNCGAKEEGDAFFYFTGIEIRGVYDGVLIWECVLCKHRWPRFRPPGRLYDYAVLMIEMERVMRDG